MLLFAFFVDCFAFFVLFVVFDDDFVVVMFGDIVIVDVILEVT